VHLQYDQVKGETNVTGELYVYDETSGLSLNMCSAGIQHTGRFVVIGAAVHTRDAPHTPLTVVTEAQRANLNIPSPAR